METDGIDFKKERIYVHMYSVVVSLGFIERFPLLELTEYRYYSSSSTIDQLYVNRKFVHLKYTCSKIIDEYINEEMINFTRHL